MTKEEGMHFVKEALREAIKWDGSSGGVIRMCILRKGEKPERHLFLPDEDYATPVKSA